MRRIFSSLVKLVSRSYQWLPDRQSNQIIFALRRVIEKEWQDLGILYIKGKGDLKVYSLELNTKNIRLSDMHTRRKSEDIQDQQEEDIVRKLVGVHTKFGRLRTEYFDSVKPKNVFFNMPMIKATTSLLSPTDVFKTSKLTLPKISSQLSVNWDRTLLVNRSFSAIKVIGANSGSSAVEINIAVPIIPEIKADGGATRQKAQQSVQKLALLESSLATLTDAKELTGNHDPIKRVMDQVPNIKYLDTKMAKYE
jgi:hypothetical protein